MKASASDISTLPSLFGSTSELSLYASNFDLHTSMSAPAAASVVLPPPPPPTGGDDVLDTAFTVLLAAASRDTPESRVQKIRRFFKSNPASIQLAKDVVESVNAQQR